MTLYKTEDVKAGVKLSRYLADQGVPMRGNRAVAKWRGGEHMSVSVNDEDGVWNDHVTGEGGSVVDACIMIEGGDWRQAVERLGDRYHIKPTRRSSKPKKATRAEILESEGYARVATYEYKDAEGKPRYWVDRFEKTDADGKRTKEFVQRGPDAENLNGIEKTLYRLPEVIAAQEVFVVEGEKDADTLSRLGLVATTNSGGAKFWRTEFNKVFEGKDVVILPDNDEAGKGHLDVVLGGIRPFARSVRVCTISKLPKGDVTDWFEKEGGTVPKLREAVASANQPLACTPEVAAAKTANMLPLVNYVEEAQGKKTIRRPRRIDEVCDEIRIRFLGFPKVIGSTLFDYTRKGREILNLYTKDDLKAWVNGTSKEQSDFQSGGNYAQWAEVMARLMQTSQKYSGIAAAPWYPAREDVFCTFDALPECDGTHAAFDELLTFFLPATDADRTLIRAFFLAPMFNTPGARPAWIIDTVDSQGSGKTTVVKACAWIYDETPIDIDLKTMDGDITHVKKRILSPEGRAKRIALFDNVTSAFKSGNLANLVTAQSITGMAPYGHGEETRQNDITWCATMNGASVDTDMATRSYAIRIRAPGEDADPFWERHLREFIDTHRAQLHAEMVDMLRTAKSRRRAKSRFGEFDAVVLSAAAGDSDEAFAAADAAIREAAEAANDDADLAAQCVEAIVNALARSSETDSGIRSDTAVAIRCTDIDEILRHTSGGIRNWTSRTVRKFIAAGHLPQFAKTTRMEHRAVREVFGRARCLIFSPSESIYKKPIHNVQLVTFYNGLPKNAGEAFLDEEF